MNGEGAPQSYMPDEAKTDIESTEKENIDDEVIELLDNFSVSDVEKINKLQSILANKEGFGDRVALALIEQGLSSSVAEHFERFNTTINQEDLFLKIISSGIETRQSNYHIRRNVNKFHNLGDRAAVALIGIGAADRFFECFDSFHLTEHSDAIVKELIELGNGRILLDNLDKFPDLQMSHDEIVREIMSHESGSVAWILDHLKKLKDLTINTDDLVSEMIEKHRDAGHVTEFIKHGFVKVGNKTAKALLNHGSNNFVASNLDRFSGLGDEVANVLIENRLGHEVVRNLDNFTELTLSHDQVVMGIIDKSDRACIHGMLQYIDKLTDLTFDQDSIVEKIINAGAANIISGNLDRLTKLKMSHDDLVEKLINCRASSSIISNLEKFTDLKMTYDDLVAKIMVGPEPYWQTFAREYERFNNQLGDQSLMAMITHAHPDFIVYSLEVFGNRTLTDEEIALKIIENNSDQAILPPGVIGVPEIVVAPGSQLRGLSDKIAYFLTLLGNQERDAVAYHVKNTPGFFKNLSVKTILQLKDIDSKELLNVIDQENITEDQKKLIKIMQETHLRSDELPSDILSIKDWSIIELAREGIEKNRHRFPNIGFLLNSGFSPLQLLVFADKENLSRHDAFLNSLEITMMLEKSKLTPDQFFNQILFQVQMDDSTYEEGTAHHHFNAIANQKVADLEDIEKKVESSSPKMKEYVSNLFNDFKSSADIFLSWKNLKSYTTKCHLLFKNYESLEQIAKLKEEGKDKLAEWYQVISKSNNVDTGALTQFLANPDQFFERKATYTNEEMHENKKPSNYYEIPNLDLTAEELRDALIEGDIDKIAAITPMEIAYEVAPRGMYLEQELQSMPLVKRVQALLGSRRNNVEGLVIDPPKLFSEVQKVIKSSNPSLNINQFFAGESLQPEVEKELEDLLESQPLRNSQVAKKGDRYVVSIHPKSSPHGVLAGNDTACCMPFGDGKAILYMMNPVCAQFTIQKENPDGTRRTLIQSVMTLNYPTSGKRVPELIKLLESKRNLAEILPDEIMLTQRTPLLVADNAEASPNFKENIDAGQLSILLYEDFFARYLRAQETGVINQSEVQVGMGYSDVLRELPTVLNETVPMAPLSYSDNIGEKSYRLTPKIAEKGVSIEERIKPTQNERLRKLSGVSDLTYLDTLSTAYLESKAYSDAKDLLSGLHDMENALIAKDINNSAKNRPNMALKYVDRDGVFRSYILAYEGKWKKEDEPCIYISDFASDRESSSAGFVLRQFCQRYKENYLEKNKPFPIYAEMRESTSYKLFMDNKPLIERWLGIEIDFDEIDAYGKSNGEKMHVIKISFKTSE